MKDAEIGQRGFLLTITPEYLEPYHLGRLEALGEIHRLKKLTSNNSEQKERIDKVTKRLDALDGYIQLIQIIEIVFFTLFSIINYVFVHDRLFAPLKVLLTNTERMKKGEALSISDRVPKDEMGVLLSSFYSISSQVHERTERLHYESIHDGLTGLKDRKTLDNEILKEVAHSRVTESK
ncbi:CHASE3 domain-containing protein [Vibrio sp. 10N.261.55.A7]|uniref:CHASE3 domain-containing protein n=1 Tax=Vibrio sp. 10N.261.55.A7 TaxID=1880851 RepID=UPI000C83AAE9|nr:CHASE3 domain-containing protein [Vibrio sp. 10N.261.55.A7]PMJ91593.1 hypothetical protein BCU12_09350 [Vibrio sp. 10N.261.55.A7]